MYSMAVFNTTQEAAPESPPRDFTIDPESEPGTVTLHWGPPKLSNGIITGEFLVSGSFLLFSCKCSQIWCRVQLNIAHRSGFQTGVIDLRLLSSPSVSLGSSHESP